MAEHHWSIPFFAPGIGVFVAIISHLYLKSENYAKSFDIKEYFSTALKLVFKKRIFSLFILNFWTFTLMFGPMISYLPLWMDYRFNSQSMFIGFTLSSIAVSAGFMSSRLGWLGSNFSIRSIISAANFAYGICLFSIPFWGMQGLLFIPTLVYGLAQGSNLPSVQSQLLGEAPPRYRGLIMSLNTTTIMLAITIAPVFSGFISQYFSMQIMFFTFGIIAFIVGFSIRK